MAELIHPSFAELDTRLYELEERGFTVFPGFLDLATTAEIRVHMDSLIGPVGSTERPRSDLRHPIPGEIMPRIANNPAALELGGILIRSHDLRMREQVLIRADPSPPPYAKPSYHIDAAFRQVEFETTPRQVYYQMLHYCNTVAPGGAAIHIVPGSHTHSYETVFGAGSQDEWRPFDSHTTGAGQVEGGVEICANEGDLIVFNPLCFHASSDNRTDQPRYVYFTSFYDPSAARLVEFVRKSEYRDGFPDSLRQGLPPELRTLLEH